METMNVKPDDELGQAQSANPFGADLTLTLADGRKLNARTEHLPGRGAHFPMSRQELWEKFEDCSGATLSKSDASALFKRLTDISSIENINEVWPNQFGSLRDHVEHDRNISSAVGQMT